MDSSDAAGPAGPTNRVELPALRDALETRFRVHLDDAGVAELTLVEVAASDRRPGCEVFSLLFSGPDPAPFRDGTYIVEHAELGSFPMFLVAVSTDGDGQHYEAIFNRPAT